MPDLSDTIETMAAEPQSASVDGQSVTSRSIDDVLKADRYLAGKEAIAGTSNEGGPRSAWATLRPAKQVPPGA